MSIGRGCLTVFDPALSQIVVPRPVAPWWLSITSEQAPQASIILRLTVCRLRRLTLQQIAISARMAFSSNSI